MLGGESTKEVQVVRMLGRAAVNGHGWESSDEDLGGTLTDRAEDGLRLTSTMFALVGARIAAQAT